MQPTRSDLENLARQAGEILRAGFTRRPGFDRPLNIEYKSVIDPVTEYDRRSEEFLVNAIRARFPHPTIITEESGALPGQSAGQWCIDPLDGTVNFSHGVPIFSVSLAYLENGLPYLGAVYDPMQDECFSAERDQGAWLNGQPIRCSSTANLDHCLLVTGFPYDIRTTKENNLDHHARLSLITQGVRRMGSAALDLCYVAAGRMDGFWELSLKIWDLAAGTLIAQEAGAIVTSVSGEANFLQPPYSLLTANASLHPRLLSILRREA